MEELIKKKNERVELMCCEKGVVIDLCELYPNIGQRIKWLALVRRQDLKLKLKRKKIS